MAIFKAISEAENEIGGKTDLGEKITQIESSRRLYIPHKEKKENLKIYGPSMAYLPNFLTKYLLLPNVIQVFAVAFTSFVFYLPLAILSAQENEFLEEPPRVEKFLVTKEFIDQVVPEAPLLDTTPPAMPSGMRFVVE